MRGQHEEGRIVTRSGHEQDNAGYVIVGHNGRVSSVNGAAVSNLGVVE